MEERPLCPKCLNRHAEHINCPTLDDILGAMPRSKRRDAKRRIKKMRSKHKD